VNGSTNAVIENLVIKGGRISGFHDGLYCKYMNNSRIEGLVVSGNTHDGVHLSGGNSGHCNGNTITDSTLSGNGSYGFYLLGGSGQSREHEDTDVAVFRGDLPAVLHHLIPNYCVWSNLSGTLRPLRTPEELLEGCRQLWIRRDSGSPWLFDLLLTPHESDTRISNEAPYPDLQQRSKSL
jgi:hypothetical protein